MSASNSTTTNTDGTTRVFYLADGTLLALPVTTHYTILTLKTGRVGAVAMTGGYPQGRKGVRLTEDERSRRMELCREVGVKEAARRYGISPAAMYRSTAKGRGKLGRVSA